MTRIRRSLGEDAATERAVRIAARRLESANGSSPSASTRTYRVRVRARSITTRLPAARPGGACSYTAGVSKQSVEALYAGLAARFAREPGVAEGRAFHSPSLTVGGKIFAMLVRGELVVKLPAGRVQELVASGEGAPFDAGKGTPMREWVRLRPADDEACTAYAREAHAFVAGA